MLSLWEPSGLLVQKTDALVIFEFFQQVLCVGALLALGTPRNRMRALPSGSLEAGAKRLDP